MKKTEFTKRLLCTAWAGICIASLAQAQGHVGGGDPSELAEFTGLNGVKLESWYTVKQDLIAGILSGKTNTLDLKTFTFARFNKIALNALRSTKVQFDHQKIKVEGVTRPCENYHDDYGIKRIHCNVEAYQSAMANFDPETQYKFVAHEYFGAAGLEPNAYGVSAYPFSAQISDHLSKIQVKRWAVRETPAYAITPCMIQIDGPDRLKKMLNELGYPIYNSDFNNDADFSIQLAFTKPHILTSSPNGYAQNASFTVRENRLGYHLPMQFNKKVLTDLDVYYTEAALLTDSSWEILAFEVESDLKRNNCLPLPPEKRSFYEVVNESAE